MNRYRKEPRDQTFTIRDLWKLHWNQVNWSTKLQLESASLLLSADPNYGDPDFLTGSHGAFATFPAKARGIEI